MAPRAFLGALLLALVCIAQTSGDWSDSQEELSGDQAITTQGIKLILNPSKPKLTAVSTSDSCPDGSSGCLSQWLMTSVHKVYETDSAGSVQRSASDILDLSAGTWEIAEEDLGATEESNPPLNVSAATFTAPFKASPPSCGQGAPSGSVPGASFQFKVLLFPADCNFTAAGTNETMEVLKGNVKTLLDIVGWPFCSPSNKLVVELALKTPKLLAPDAPRTVNVVNGTEAEQEARELEEALFEHLGAEPAEENEMDDVPASTQSQRRLLGRGDKNDHWQGKASINRSNNDTGSAGDSVQAGNSGNSGKPSGKEKLTRWEAVEKLAEAKGRMNATTQSRLAEKVAGKRLVAGLGKRDNPHRIFLALPGTGAIDAKLDVPTMAIVDGVNTQITATAPSLNKGEGVQRVVLTFPAFDTLSYDPTSSFSTSDTIITNSIETGLSATSAALPLALTHPLLLAACALVGAMLLA